MRRWFKRKFGYARLICLALLIGFAALRIADPAPIEELRVRTFDTFQAHRAAREDRKAGHHCRYRRKEPGQARPVAVAADADRRHRHQPDQARRRRDRLRHRVRGARPAQSRRGGRYDALSRRGNPKQVARTAEQRSDFCRCDPAIARGIGRDRAAAVIRRISTRRFR